MIAAAVTLFVFGCDQQDDWRPAASTAAEATYRVDQRSAWLRITPSGLNAITSTIGSLSPNDLVVDIPRVEQDDITVCPDGGCAVRLDPERLEVGLSERPGLNVDVAVRAVTDAIPVRYEQTWPCAFTSNPECSVLVDTAMAQPRTIDAQVGFGFRIDARTGLTVLEVASAEMGAGVSAEDVTVAGRNRCGTLWCSVANVAGVTEMLAERANAALTSAVTERTAALSCRPCSMGCDPGSSCAEDGLCRRSRGENSGRCDPAPLAASIEIASPDEQRRVSLAASLADDVAQSASGLDLALRLSARPSFRHRCAPLKNAPRTRPLPVEILGETDAHARLVIGEASIARMLWAAHQAGVGCYDADASILEELDISMLLPTLSRLSALSVAHPVISVRPLEVPSVAIGEDGSMRVEATRVRIDIGANVMGAFARLASGTVTMRGRVALVPNGTRLNLQVAQNQIETEVESVWGSPLLGASDDTLRNTFEVIVRLAKGAVPDSYPLIAEPLPGSPRLARRPLLVEHDGVRAYAFDLRFGN